MNYDELLIASDSLGLVVREKDLQAFDGRIKGRRVAIRQTIKSQRKKACVLAEELGHHFTSAGYILDDSTSARKQEIKARLWAFDLQIGLSGIIEAKKAGCNSAYEIAEHLNVTEELLNECLSRYHEKYGVCVEYNGYMIRFDPCIEVESLQQEAEDV